MKPNDIKNYHKLGEKIAFMESEAARLKVAKAEIENALMQMYDSDYRTILLATIEGKSQADIACQFGVDQATISRRLSDICTMWSLPIAFDSGGAMRRYGRGRKIAQINTKEV